MTTQAVSSREAFSNWGSCDWMGTTRVNMNDEHKPARARTSTTGPCGVPRDSLLRAFSSRDIDARLSAWAGQARPRAPF